MSAAITCERAIEVEDLVLGLVASDDLEAHLATCADCMQARDMFLEERALFEARPPVEAPPLVLPRPPVVRRIASSSFIPALAGIAAAVVALVGTQIHRDDCDEPAPIATIAPVSDETVPTGICKAPDSPAPAFSIAWSAGPMASKDEAACVPSPNATCGDVTYSLATP
jgi:hypothetical protein